MKRDVNELNMEKDHEIACQKTCISRRILPDSAASHALQSITGILFSFVEEVTLVNTAPKMSRVLQDVKAVLLMYMSFLICQKSLWL